MPSGTGAYYYPGTMAETAARLRSSGRFAPGFIGHPGTVLFPPALPRRRFNSPTGRSGANTNAFLNAPSHRPRTNSEVGENSDKLPIIVLNVSSLFSPFARFLPLRAESAAVPRTPRVHVARARTCPVKDIPEPPRFVRVLKYAEGEHTREINARSFLPFVSCESTENCMHTNRDASVI